MRIRLQNNVVRVLHLTILFLILFLSGILSSDVNADWTKAGSINGVQIYRDNDTDLEWTVSLSRVSSFGTAKQKVNNLGFRVPTHREFQSLERNGGIRRLGIDTAWAGGFYWEASGGLVNGNGGNFGSLFPSTRARVGDPYAIGVRKRPVTPITPGQGQTVHLILAIDHLAGGEAGDADAGNMLQVMTNGIKETQFEYTDLNLTDSQAKIFETIRNIRVGNNDAVLFYYSGHGAMNTNNNNALTYCMVQKVGEKPDGSTVPTKWTFITKKSIIDLLQAKNPRLIVVLSDCCSEKNEIPCSPGKVGGISSAEITLPLYRSLFFESKGLVDINGAQDGKPSLWYSTNSKGSVFTGAFCSCLCQYENQRMDWKTFFPIVQKTTENRAEKEIQENSEYWKKEAPGLTGQRPKAISLGNSGGTVKLPNGEKTVFGVRGSNRNDYNGVTVTQVLKGYPGAKAGLEKGDVILEIDGQKIGNEQDYINAVDVAGKIMNLKVRNVRNGQILNMRVTLQ